MDDLPRKRIAGEETATGYLSKLDEDTMGRAWGAEKSYEYRRRVVSAAIIFGRQLEERMLSHPPGPDEDGIQRFLMALMNSAISEFAQHESIDEEAATEFLGDVETRDYVLEFNEVLDEYHDAPAGTLDELLREAVENRRDKAIWAQHWSSG
jgi:hypothetical protein